MIELIYCDTLPPRGSLPLPDEDIPHAKRQKHAGYDDAVRAFLNSGEACAEVECPRGIHPLTVYHGLRAALRPIPHATVATARRGDRVFLYHTQSADDRRMLREDIDAMLHRFARGENMTARIEGDEALCKTLHSRRTRLGYWFIHIGLHDGQIVLTKEE